MGVLGSALGPLLDCYDYVNWYGQQFELGLVGIGIPIAVAQDIAMDIATDFVQADIDAAMAPSILQPCYQGLGTSGTLLRCCVRVVVGRACFESGQEIFKKEEKIKEGENRRACLLLYSDPFLPVPGEMQRYTSRASGTVFLASLAWAR